MKQVFALSGTLKEFLAAIGKLVEPCWMQVCAVSHGGSSSPGGDQRLVKSIHVSVSRQRCFTYAVLCTGKRHYLSRDVYRDSLLEHMLMHNPSWHNISWCHHSAWVHMSVAHVSALNVISRIMVNEWLCRLIHPLQWRRQKGCRYNHFISKADTD